MAKGDEKKQAAAAQGQPPAVDQQTKKAEADAVTIGALHEMIMVVGEQVAALTERVAALEGQLMAIGEPVSAVLSSIDAIPQVEFDQAWLEGLVFKGSKEVKSEAGDNGRSVKRYQPFTRAATHDDVMSWRVAGDEVSIVLSDGTKHQVER